LKQGIYKGDGCIKE
jgi:hypothetical protein